MNRRTFLVGSITAASTLARPRFSMAQTGAGLATPPSLAEANPFITGNGLELIPAGSTDSVEIVAQGALVSLSVPVVLRNNTPDVVTISNVIGTARDAAGTLLDAAGYSEIVPKHVQPNGVAFGMTVFSEMNIPIDAKIELEVEFEPSGSGFIQYIDLPIIEIEQTASGFVGTVENTTDQDLDLVSVVGVTLSETGQPIGHFNGYVTNNVIPPGGKGTFDGYTSGNPSQQYLAAAYAIAY